MSRTVAAAAAAALIAAPAGFVLLTGMRSHDTCTTVALPALSTAELMLHSSLDEKRGANLCIIFAITVIFAILLKNIRTAAPTKREKGGELAKPAVAPTVLITESPASSASSSPVKAEAAKAEDAGEAHVTYPSTDLMMHEHAGPWIDVALDGPSAF